jgi:hypothetical protein
MNEEAAVVGIVVILVESQIAPVPAGGPGLAGDRIVVPDPGCSREDDLNEA